MKKNFIFILSFFLILSNFSLANNITIKKTKNHHLTPKPTKNYFMVDNEIVRAGEQSQKFFLPHGVCNGQDCRRSAQRTERIVNRLHKPPRKYGKPLYYAWSIYFPKEFTSDWAGNQTLLGQVKMKNVGFPIWSIELHSSTLKRGMGFFLKLRESTVTASMHCGTFKVGEWIDIIVKADYAKEKKSLENYKTFEVWINGEYVKSCSHSYPLIRKKTLKESHSSGYSSSGKLDFRYGVYRPNVGAWLMSNNRIKKKLKYLRDPDGNEHVIMHPFKLDWEKKIPTATVYYDEIRIGKSKDEVDINLQTKPVD